MRILPLLLVSLALALAGCAKKNDTGGEPTPTTSGTTPTGTSTMPTGTTSTTSPTSPTNTTSPTPLSPKDIFSQKTVTFDPTTCAPMSSCTGYPMKFTVDPGYKTLTLNVTWACAQGVAACITNDAAITVGSNTCTLPAGPVQPPVPACTKTFSAADGSVDAKGNGAVTATWKLTES